jgi:radical SAM protein with 4Fe4S-binding SPASM domain
MIKKLKHYSIPHLLHIEMSYACNSRCIFCYNPYRKSPIDYPKIDKIVEAVHRSYIPHVYLIGGEPSLLKTEKLNQYINLLSERSSITIVTNGLIYKKGLSKKLACIGIPIHGDRKTHEMLTNNKGGYNKTIETIKNYVKDGFDVRCIPVLMSVNYNQMYDVIKLSKELGMESVFVDRFESGGIGSKVANKLKPSLSQFRKALGQMIKARDDFNIPVGFGTAIPFCLDERLIKENMWADCGAGVTFSAVDPNGGLRICNQSSIIYGNILKESVEKIWNKRRINEFRDLRWVIQPCRDCPFLRYCTCGCKVDLNCSNKYCVDYAVRENKKELISLDKLKKLSKTFFKNLEERNSYKKFPKQYRSFIIDRYTKLNLKHKEKYLITRYQTIVLDRLAVKIMKEILKGINSEADLVNKFKPLIEEKEIRGFITQLIKIKAITLK